MKNRIPLLLAFFLPAWHAAMAEPSAMNSPQTMRLDYVHSGNRDSEMFSLDELVIEPLPWTGNMQQPIDRTRAAITCLRLSTMPAAT